MKNYQIWHPLKQRINNSVKPRPFFHAKQVWFCHLGENVGSEQDGKGLSFLRPVLVLKKFNKEVLWGLPLTSSIKHSKFYHSVYFGNDRRSCVILSQIRLIDARRLSYRIGMVSDADFAEVIKKLKDLF